ncbi:MAG: MBL fold metallo-hydrolase [Elusimicrobia bacterium]|nr:MBL fold metallo-hydrolase [Elusimicrobiota bacterium]
MKIENLGGATAIVTHKGKRILFDPWLNDGIFHGAWYHFPPLQKKIGDLGRVDWIFISHIHEDHCAEGTLRYINRDAEVILMDRQPDYVGQFLSNRGFRFKKIHCVKPFTSKRITSLLSVDMIPADPSHTYNYSIDSALVMKWDGWVIYNANDCPPYDQGMAYLSGRYGHVDLALLPYTGGSGYPACYSNLSANQKHNEKKRLREEGVKSFLRTVTQIAPTFAMPFADQYVVAGSRSILNRFLPHPPCPGDLLERYNKANLVSKLLLLNPGQAFDLGTGRKNPPGAYRVYTESDRKKHISSLKGKIYDHEKINVSRSVPISRLLALAREHLWKKQLTSKYFPKFSYLIHISDWDRLFLLDLQKPSPMEITNSMKKVQMEPYLRVSVSSTLLLLLLVGHVSWNIADAALFLDYERVPNHYDPTIHEFLNHLKI